MQNPSLSPGQEQKEIINWRILYEINNAFVNAATLDEALKKTLVILQKRHPGSEEINITYTSILQNEAGQPEWAEIIAWVFADERPLPIPMGTKFYLADYSTSALWIENPSTPLLIANVNNDERINQTQQESYRQGGTQATILIPLQVAARWVGLLSINWPTAQNFSPEDERFYQAFMKQTAAVIENYALIDQSQKRAVELDVIKEIAQTVTHHLQLEQLFLTIYDRLQQMMSTDAFFVAIYQPESGLVSYPIIIDNNKRYTHPPARPNLNIAKTLQTGQPLLVNRTPADLEKTISKPEDRLGDRNSIAKSLVFIPLQLASRAVGVLSVQSYSFNAYAMREVELLSSIAPHITIAIENARLYQETQTQAQQTQQILYTVQDGILLLDQNLQIRLANPVGQEYLQALTGATIGDTLTHIQDLNLNEILKTADSERQHKIILNSPIKRFFQLSAYSMTTDNNQKNWVIVISDDTENHLAQERMQQQDRLAAVGQLAAGIAHDFNNILASIIGFADLMRIQQDVSQSAEKNLGVIIEQGQRAAQLIRQILDFSRQTAPQKEPLNLATYLETIVALLKRTIPENIQIILEVEDSTEDYILNSDSAQLQQVLTNLAVNARDAMPSGGLLRFKLSRFALKPEEFTPWHDLLPGNWIVISVSDTGVGIPPENYNRLFEPFFTTKDVGKGTGLGLAQVYGIVKQHEGHIKVDSHLGQGTTFNLYFPASQPQQTASAETLLQDNIPTGKGETILLVEDEDIVRFVAKDMLEHLGYKVLTAANGFEAITAFDHYQNEIALILTDMSMPEIDGLTLAQTLKSRSQAPKIVAITGYPSPAALQELKSQGLDAWLQKPLSLEQLAETIHKVLAS